MANNFRSTGSWRNAMMAGAEGLNSPLASGFMSKGIGSGNREAMQQQGKASKFLDDYVSTIDSVGNAYTGMAADAGKQGINAIASHEIHEAKMAAMQAQAGAGAFSGALGAIGQIAGFFL